MRGEERRGEERRGEELTDGTEVEEERQFSPAGQAGVGLTELIEEGVRTRLQRRQPGHRRVLQQPGAQSDGLGGRARLKHLTGERESERHRVI